MLLALLFSAVSCYAGLPDSNPTPFASGDDDDLFGDDDDFEGDEPGECSDGADNDQDGAYDCDDPDCAGSPDCSGDDDDTTDDDDDTSSPNSPVITGLTGGWNSSTAFMEFSLTVSDPDCDLGSPTVHWMVDASLQSPLSSSGPNLGCGGYIDFGTPGYSGSSGWVSLTRTYSYVFAFSVEDSAGNTSAWESISLVAQ